MKKMVNALKCAVFTAAAAGVLALSGCASAPSAPPAAPMVQRPQIIDWQGAAYGTEIPEWARIILQGDEVDKIQKMPEFSKKYVKFASARGQDVDLLKAWAAADAADTISRSITQNVTSELGTAVSGNKDDAATVKMAESAFFLPTNSAGLKNRANSGYSKRKRAKRNSSMSFCIRLTRTTSKNKSTARLAKSPLSPRRKKKPFPASTS